QFMSGTPVDLNNAFNYEQGAFDGSNMWGIAPAYNTLDHAGTPLVPVIGPPGRGTRDLLRNGGMQHWHMSLFKNIPLGANENRYLQLRLEAFNALNHPNFQTKSYPINVDGPWQWTYSGQAGGGSYNPTFSAVKGDKWGTFTDTYNSSGGPGSFRVVQLAAKFYF